MTAELVRERLRTYPLLDPFVDVGAPAIDFLGRVDAATSEPEQMLVDFLSLSEELSEDDSWDSRPRGLEGAGEAISAIMVPEAQPPENRRGAQAARNSGIQR